MHDNRDPFTADPKRSPRALLMALLAVPLLWIAIIAIGVAAVNALVPVHP